MAAFPFEQFFSGSLNAALAGGGLLCIIDPANKFVAAKRCQLLPQVEYCRIEHYRLAQIFLRLMHRSIEKAMGHAPKYSRRKSAANAANFPWAIATRISAISI